RWESHGDILAHKTNAKNSDQAYSALIKDLKQRGLWNDTLIVCGSEFGRTPVREVGGGGGRWREWSQARPRSQPVRIYDVASRRGRQRRDHLCRHRRVRL